MIKMAEHFLASIAEYFFWEHKRKLARTKKEMLKYSCYNIKVTLIGHLYSEKYNA